MFYFFLSTWHDQMRQMRVQSPLVRESMLYPLSIDNANRCMKKKEQNCLAGKWLTLAILDLAAWPWLKQPDLMQIQLNFNPALCIPPSHVQCIFPSHAQIIPSILHTTEYSRNFATPYLTAMSVSLSAITQDSSLLMFLKTEWWWQCMACCSYGSSGDCVILWGGIFRHILERKKEKVCE